MSRIGTLLGLAFAAVTFVSVAQAQSGPKAATGRHVTYAQAPRGVVLQQKRATAAPQKRASESAFVKGRTLSAERRSTARSAPLRRR